MIGYWHHHVVCLSVRLSVTMCIVALRVDIQGASVFLTGKLLLVHSDTFAVEYNRLATKRTAKKRVKENANVRFLRLTKQQHVHWFIARYLLLRI